MLKLLSIIVIFFLCIEATSAHVMVAQHATLRFQTKGVYFLASYPVSAFDGVDNNHDLLMDPSELKIHYDTLVQRVRNHVQLTEDGKVKELEGLLINLSHSHSPQKAVSQLLVMGRFKPVQKGKLVFKSSLFGTKKHEKSLKIRVTWSNKPIEFVLTPQKTEISLSYLKKLDRFSQKQIES